jgi:hypothetical protein
MRNQIELLLCQVLIGMAHDMGELDALDKAHSARVARKPLAAADSMTGTSTMLGGTRMWAVYDSSQVYPAYIVRIQVASPCHPSAKCDPLYKCGSCAVDDSAAAGTSTAAV